MDVREITGRGRGREEVEGGYYKTTSEVKDGMGVRWSITFGG